ncbi:nectin-4-like isoform X2 [Branchiostoma floridae x Branchiostoma belcheri]
MDGLHLNALTSLLAILAVHRGQCDPLFVNSEVNAVVGEEVTLPVTVANDERILSLVWRKVEGAQRVMVYSYIPAEDYRASLGPLEGRAELVGLSLKIDKSQRGDAGLYVIEATLVQSGPQEANINLNILVPPTVTVGPRNPYVVRWRTNVSVSCSVGDPVPKIKGLSWRKDGKVIDVSRAKYGHGDVESPSLQIRNVSKTDWGTYTCVADHKTGISSDSLELQVEYPAIITEITKSLTANAGDRVLLECRAEGNPEPTVMWSRAGSRVLPGTQAFSDGLSTLTLGNVKKNDSGVYTCVASNNIGESHTRSVRLRVEETNSLTLTAIIAGACAGGAWIILCLVLLILWIRRRRRRRNDAAYYSVGSREFQFLASRRLAELQATKPMPPPAAPPKRSLMTAGTTLESSPRRHDPSKPTCETLDKSRMRAAEGGRRLARVIYSYHPQEEDELELKVDDILEVVKGDDSGGWWYGRLGSKLGLFPSNYVEMMTTASGLAKPSAPRGPNGRGEKPSPGAKAGRLEELVEDPLHVSTPEKRGGGQNMSW